MNMPTILVTGATGNVGRPLVTGLLAEGARVRALTRDPARAGFPPGVTVAGGDYAAPGVLTEAARGADAVFVNIGALREHAVQLIAAARGAGVRKIVMLSSIAVRDDGDQVLSVGRQHKAVEDAVKAVGADWTVLRCGGFATNTLTWAASVRSEGVVRFPFGEAALALIAEQDIAAAAVRVLTDPGHAGQTYHLTGQESLTQIQQAEAIGKAIGRPVRFEELSPEQFRQFAAPHFPAPVVEDLLTVMASYVGQSAYIAPDLEKITGRRATSYAQWAAQHADAFRPVSAPAGRT
jgi:uncharacterized protein YbjT (DUF2867 family)